MIYIILKTTIELENFILNIMMDTAKNLIQVDIQSLTGTQLEASQSSDIRNIQQSNTQKSSLKTQEILKSNDSQVEVLEKQPEELSQLSDIKTEADNSWLIPEPISAMDVPEQQKRELAYQVDEIKETFERKGITLDAAIEKLKDIMENAYKMSPKDTPYDDYETRLKAIQTWAKLLQLGKPQSVYNVLNMRGKPPQIN